MATTDTKFLRNKDLIDQSKLDELTIVGLGGIGSAVVTLASAMGFTKIVGYDDDTLEEHNLSTCVYPHTFLGSTKAHAAEKTAIAHGCPNPQMIPSKWTLTSVLPLSNKVIMGPDNFIDGWIPQGENAVEPCTAKHTIFTASMAASFGLSQVLMLDKKPYYQYIWIGLLPLSVKKENMVFPKRGEK